MLFSNRIYPTLPAITFNNISIECSSSVRFLGVELNEKLKFDNHINKIARKISKNTGILCKPTYFVPKSVLINLYRTLIEPYLNYCPIIFGGAYSSHIQPLGVAQRKTVRIISRVNSQAHSNPLFALDVLKFNDLYKLQLGI